MDLKEFCFSDTAIRLQIDNTPTPEIIENIQWLCDKILDPLAAKIGSPVLITSGYRSVELNKTIGGSPTSQHCLGQAADIHVAGYSPQDLFQYIRQKTQLPFDQLILEFPPDGWVHISYSRTQRRCQVLRADKINGETVYSFA